jgi:hypothetical protein
MELEQTLNKIEEEKKQINIKFENEQEKIKEKNKLLQEKLINKSPSNKNIGIMKMIYDPKLQNQLSMDIKELEKQEKITQDKLKLEIKKENNLFKSNLMKHKQEIFLLNTEQEKEQKLLNKVVNDIQEEEKQKREREEQLEEQNYEMKIKKLDTLEQELKEYERLKQEIPKYNEIVEFSPGMEERHEERLQEQRKKKEKEEREI